MSSAGVAPEKYAKGASAVKVTKVVSKNSNGEHLPYMLKRLKKKVLDIMKVPTVHRNLCANRGLIKILGMVQPPTSVVGSTVPCQCVCMFQCMLIMSIVMLFCHVLSVLYTVLPLVGYSDYSRVFHPLIGCREIPTGQMAICRY